MANHLLPELTETSRSRLFLKLWVWGCGEDGSLGLGPDHPPKEGHVGNCRKFAHPAPWQRWKGKHIFWITQPRKLKGYMRRFGTAATTTWCSWTRDRIRSQPRRAHQQTTYHSRPKTSKSSEHTRWECPLGCCHRCRRVIRMGCYQGKSSSFIANTAGRRFLSGQQRTDHPAKRPALFPSSH